MKRITALLLSTALLLAGCGSSSSAAVESTASSTGTLPAGTYTGSAPGRNGTVTVEVTLSDSAITDVKVTDSKETENIGTAATEQLPEKIVAQQSYAVDGLSGATLSSNAVKNAVKDALESAGVDPERFNVPEEHTTGQKIEDTADVVVVGGGGAGLAAAVSAVQSGAESVIIVEKTDILGGDTNVNGGIYNTPDEDLQSKTEMTEGNKQQVEAALAETPVSDEHAALQAKVKEEYDAYLASGETGIFDSADWYALQTWNGGDKVANLTLVENMAEKAYSGYQWLEDLGATFKDSISQGPGSLYPRTHDTTTGLGAEFVDTYATYLQNNYGDNWKVYYGVTADELIVDDNGAVTGVHGTDSDDNEYTISAANGVVLATGGFAGNVEMRVEYCQGEKWPDLGSNLGCTGVASDTGDGINMAKAIGANLVDMDQIQLLHMCSPTKGTTDDNSAKDKGVASIIFVNKEGNRFTAEDGRRDDICKAALAQTDGLFYAIESWDGNDGQTLDTLVTNNGVTYTDEIAQGNMYIGDTLEDLAAAIGVNPDNLKKAVEDYNASVDAGATSDEFGRTTFTDKLLTGPFIAVPRKPSAHHTMGGVQINTNTEVLDTSGNVIEGLYAAGEVTGGIHGANRLGGNAIVDTVVYGKTAGEQAAAYNRD